MISTIVSGASAFGILVMTIMGKTCNKGPESKGLHHTVLLEASKDTLKTIQNNSPANHKMGQDSGVHH